MSVRMKKKRVRPNKGEYLFSSAVCGMSQVAGAVARW